MKPTKRPRSNKTIFPINKSNFVMVASTENRFATRLVQLYSVKK